MSGPKRGSWLESGWRNVREAGMRRIILTAVLIVCAVLVARYSWDIPGWAVPDSLRIEESRGRDLPTPGLGDAERALYDLRHTLLAQKSGQDDRIVLVTYDDQALIALRKRSPLDRGLLARALRQLDGMGAKAIGIDILFDQPQDEDDELIAALRSMKTPVRVAYAEIAVNGADIGYDQQKYLETLLARLNGSNARLASIRLDDALGVTRRWPREEVGLPPLLSLALIADAREATPRDMSHYDGALRFRRQGFENEPLYPSLSILNFVDPAIVPYLAPQIQGRYVLIGGDIVGTDRVKTSFTSISGEEPPGLQIHADMLAQALDGKARLQLAPWVLWIMALLVVVTAVLTGLLEWGNWRVYLLFVAQGAVFFGVPFVMEMRGVDTYGLPAAGWMVGWIIAFAAVTSTARASSAVQRSFAQGALGKYLPKEMAEEILENPKLLALHGEKKELFVLFSDLEGFTKLSHAIPPEMVAKLLNRYLDMLSDVVFDHGGVIDKFVGDAVVAFWGAPIAKPDDGERAARAGYAIWQAGEAFRAEVRAMDPALPPVGKTRVGLHWGEAVVGNFGSDDRIQYTAFGDSMNTAARLESANKALDSAVMASREFADRSGLDWWRPMGKVILRGRATPIELMEPAPAFPREDIAILTQAYKLMPTDRDTAIAKVIEVALRHPNDAALANLVHRLQIGDVEGCYELA